MFRITVGRDYPNCRETQVARKDSTVKQHILATTVALISDLGSEKVRIADIARQASVGVPTIYYHFDSRSKLLAEAQVLRYEESMAPLRKLVDQIEESVSRRDEPVFWRAINEFVASVWEPSRIDDKFEVGRWLMDDSVDQFMRDRFLEIMDDQYRRWLDVVCAAQTLGWIYPALDCAALTSLFWAASVGQVMTTNSAYQRLTPESAVALFQSIVRTPVKDVPRP